MNCLREDTVAYLSYRWPLKRRDHCNGIWPVLGPMLIVVRL